ncbi:NAD(P)-binding protein [Pseudovirgaria hyperparasitica]|uniref:NAD(P)-binding protein n=1 Tax=Pseudovirgaria hyperparasitica TaxID=470096 RepID=A0A6A6WGC1_9PEZI|nr:NAD(P)-binding protein [Pseudovirgaria hyperparasitica]KAF2761114.1 NAD(P)-binding protein [Pseudovirgaria hyperparasitica]
MSAISKGSLVLVTGANGFIASHTVDQLLIAGFKVRGTVRSEDKGKWLLDHFNKKYGPGSLEIAVVPDMSVKGAFDNAVKGVSGVVHMASILTFDPDPQKVIPVVIAGIEHVLESTAAEPSVKRLVYTSSSTAATNPKPNVKFDIDENTWNEECVERAWAPGPIKEDRAWDVYGASKTQAEQALWKFVKEKKPHFVANSVLPNTNMGPIIDPDNQPASTGNWVPDTYNGGTAMDTPAPQYHVDVRDCARLHVAALIDPEIQNERVFAFTDPFNKNIIIDILQELRPDHKFNNRLENPGNDLSVILRKPRTEEILRKNFGQEKLIPLRESVEANIAHLK